MKGPIVRCKATGARLYERDGKMFDGSGNVVEFFDGEWRPVVNGDRVGWWRFNEHHDRDGYCDNPARGY